MKPSLIGGILLIIWTSIDGGMLALPVATAQLSLTTTRPGSRRVLGHDNDQRYPIVRSQFVAPCREQFNQHGRALNLGFGRQVCAWLIYLGLFC